MFVRINNTDDVNYSRIGQIIFKLKTSEGQDVTEGVSLSGEFSDSLYGAPDYNNLIGSNWSVTKLAGVPHPGFTTETWLEVLTVPSTAVSIEIDETASGFFGSTNIYWYQVDGGLATSPFANDSEAVSPSQILIINSDPEPEPEQVG